MKKSDLKNTHEPLSIKLCVRPPDFYLLYINIKLIDVIESKVYFILNKFQVNNSYTFKHTNCLSSPDVENALNNIKTDFAVVPKKRSTKNIVLVCERFYAFFIAKELRSYNNSPTDTYTNISN